MKPNYEQDNIKLFNADCMDIMKQYDDKYFDLAIVDPPYGIKRFEKSVESKAMPNFKDKLCSWDKIPTQEYWDELFRISKNQIVWGANNFNMPKSEYFIVWDKKQPCPNFARCEYAWVSMGLKKPAKICELAYWGGMKHSVEKNYHPTQKPVKLYNWIYAKYAKPGQKILDSHLGSGSNAIAAHYAKIGEFIGIELDKDYFDSACKRIYNETRQLDLLLSYD